MKVFRVALVALCVSVLVGCGNPVSSSPTGAPPRGAAPTLGDYKFAPVAARAPSDPQPYGTKVAVAMARPQIYFDGVTYQGTTVPQHLGYDSGTSQFASLHKGTDSAWTDSPHASTGAYLGDNGKQSIVSVVFTPEAASWVVGKNQGKVSLRVWDGTKTTAYYPFSKAEETFDLYLCGWGGNWNYQTNNELSIAAGDLTGDGKDEIGFCVGNRFVIVNGNLSQVLYQGWATGSGEVDTDTTTMHPSRVTAGDFKDDGTIAFVTATGSAKANTIATYKVYAGAEVKVTTGSLGGGSCPLSLMYANVVLGDLDGNGKDEVIFAGRQDLTTNGCNVVTASWDPKTANLAFKPKGYTIPVAGGDWAYNPIPPLVAFHPNQNTSVAPDQFDVLLAWDQILMTNIDGSFTLGYKGLTKIARSVYTNVAAGDVNADNQDELISLSSVGGVGFEVYSLGSGSAFTKTTIGATVGKSMALCAADLDGNNVVLEYLGSSVRYTNPQLVAVIASAPYYPEALTNPTFGNSSTSLGTGKAESTDHSNSLTVSASLSFGANADCPLWSMIGDTTVKTTFGASFTYGFSSTKEISASQTYTVLAGHDSVIYSCIPYDVYEYKVLRPLPKEGKPSVLTVDFPRTPQIVMMERNAFNALPSNPVPVGTTVLGHTLGVPFSYPTKAMVTNACANNNGIYDATGATVPLSAGDLATSQVSITESTGHTVGVGLSVAISVETIALGALFGAEVGMEDNYQYTITATKNTDLSGTVAGLNSSAKPFKFGVTGYSWADPKVQKGTFMVVTYWVGEPSLN